MRALAALGWAVFQLGIVPATGDLPVENEWQRQIFREVAREYAPTVAVRGQVLHLEIQEQGLGETAMADSDGHDLIVRVGREMLRSARMTPDGLRVILCHELGHIFGGAPRRPIPAEWEGPTAEDGDSLLSAEGQADSYATTVCFRRLVRGQDHRAALAGITIPPTLSGECDESWGAGSEGSLMCQRASLGGWNLLNLVKDFPISFAKRDASSVEKTERGAYPARQCRLDTVISGARCPDEKDLVLDAVDPRGGQCSVAAGARPACWYRY